MLERETKQSIFLTSAAAEKYFMNNNKNFAAWIKR